MTAQIGDTFRYKKKEYNIVALSAPIQFQPEQYGLIPEPINTACWNGYWCDYNINSDGIFLEHLYINTKDGIYPKINGADPDKEGRNKKLNFQYMGHHKYSNLHIRIEYTGKILVGSDFISDYYIHMGYQRPWSYEKLLELIFEEGVLLDTIDHSDFAGQLRAREDLQNVLPVKKEDILKFIEDSFSLDMDVKAWWL